MSEGIRVGIVGAGSIGGVISAMLADNGYNVELARRHKSQINLGNCVGLEIIGKFGTRTVLVPSVAGVESFTSQKDVILILTKAYDAKDCAERAKKFLAPNGVMVCVENVMNIDEIGSVVGLDKLIGVIIDWRATRHNMGQMEVTKAGGMRIGTFGEVDKRMVDIVQEMFSSITPTAVCDNMYGLVYTQTMMSSGISSMGALTGLSIGRTLMQKNAGKVLHGVIAEGVNIANKYNIKIEPFDDIIDFYKFAGNGIGSSLYRHKMIKKIIKSNMYVTSASLGALENKQNTEVDYLNGYLIDLAQRENVAVPTNKRIYQMIKEIENGSRNCNVENMQDFYLLHPNKYLEKLRG